MKILVIDFYHSTANVGGLRWKKFVKYLPGYDIQPIVLTSGHRDRDDDNVFHVPYLFSGSKSSGEILGDSTNMGRMKRFIRGNFFIPDQRRLWFAYSKAKRLIRRHKINVVITTGPPHSIHLIGLKLKKRLGIKWIADFRDPFMQYFYKDFNITNLSTFTYGIYFDRIKNTADRIIQVEDGLVEGADIVSNGFDPDDFKGPVPEPGTDAVYVGTLHDRNLLPDIDFKHVQGISHDEAINEIRKAGCLLVTYPADVIPSKIYEYMASGRPVFSFGIDGKGAELIKRCAIGSHYAIDEKIELLSYPAYRNETEIEKYNVRNITKQLAEVICSVKNV